MGASMRVAGRRRQPVAFASLLAWLALAMFSSAVLENSLSSPSFAASFSAYIFKLTLRLTYLCNLALHSNHTQYTSFSTGLAAAWRVTTYILCPK